MRVAVTGATGNVGSAVLRALAADTEIDEVVAIARRPPQGTLPGHARFVAADVATDDLDAAFAGADAIVHLAWAIQPSRDHQRLEATNVLGTRRVLDAASRAGVGTVVHASSIGAYSPGPKNRPVEESWPTFGVETSFYSRHKVACERLVEIFQREHPETRTVRLRPGLIFQRRAGSELRRLFAGPFLPSRLAVLVPAFPAPRRLVLQAVHADDVAQAYRLAVHDERANGAYNVAAEPVLGPRALAGALRALPVPVPGALMHAAAAATYRLRLTPTPPGWVDMGLGAPVMSTARIRKELGWEPTVSATDALREALSGMAAGAGSPTAPLHPDEGLRGRAHELRTGVGARL